MTAIDAQARRLGADHEFRTQFEFVDDVLPAQTVAIFFLNRARDDERVFALQPQVFDHFASIDHCRHAALLIGTTATPNRILVFFTFVRIAFRPKTTIANADRVDMGIHGNDVRTMTNIALDVAHRIDDDFVESDLFHLLFDAQNDLALLARFTRDADHVAKELRHFGAIRLRFLLRWRKDDRPCFLKNLP